MVVDMSNSSDFDSDQISDRLKEVVSWSKQKQTAFARQAFVSPSFLSEVLAKKSKVNAEILFGIATHYPEINLRWVLTGEGDMLKTEVTGDAAPVFREKIDVQKFVKLLERLAQDDFEGRKLRAPFFGYFAALIYNRVLRENEERWAVAVEEAVKELNLILRDQGVANIEILIANAIEHRWPRESLAPLEKILEKSYKELGPARGKFAGRMFVPGGSLEAEFLKGISLSEDGDGKQPHQNS